MTTVRARAARCALWAAPLLLAGLLLVLACAPRSRTPDFNVVLIVLDTLRADRLSFYGHPRETAPHLADLAARGVLFENAYTTTSWTAPATASLFTGLYPLQHGVWTGFRASERLGLARNRIPKEAETIPELMERLGYRTLGVADNVNIGEEMGFSAGFARFEKRMYESAQVLREIVAGWRNELTDDERYFLYLHFMDPHAPYHARQEWFRDGGSQEHLKRLEEWQRGGDQLPWVERMLDRYDSEIGFADSILADLHRELDWDRKTLVIVVADHGEEFYDHDRRSHGTPLYQEVMKVPMLVFFPERFAPRRVSDNVSVVDVLPTLRELLGEHDAAATGGTSLAALLSGGQLESRPVFGMFRGENAEREVVDELQAVVYDKWKYIRRLSPPGEELYDLSSDPYEQVNLIDQHPEVAAQLRKRFSELEREAPRLERSFASAEEQSEELDEHLRSLGYVN